MKAPRTLLVANRGEISARIQRTARAMGVSTVAVFSEADANAPFVKLADRAVCIGPAPAAESYLCIERLIEAARLSGADSVHPGFGFLAENADFAAACRAAGLVFVGPRPEAIRAMGSKREAKRIVAAAGVPVVPGAQSDDQSVSAIARSARELELPLLVKASAGGGGKGMRIVRSHDELESAIESAQREAKSAFGDATLLVERYIERPRHVEIQILGDEHGNLVHLFERECSIQRRHQKIIEESPSPALDEATRRAMGEAALAVARAVDYTNAGTVEFILAPDGRFYFLEVNTRLQVEHPVTECVTGIDIVREQIRIARGEKLSFAQSDLSITGSAIECRLYAEDADNGFLPTTGSVLDWSFPELPGLRVDSGVAEGSEVGIHYDPMLAKVITHAPTRDEAIQKMIRALSGASIQGLVTNRAFLLRVLSHPELVAGRTHTHFIEEHLASARSEKDAESTALSAIAATLSVFARARRERRVLPALPPGFRNNRYAPEWIEWQNDGETLRVEYVPKRSGGFELAVRGEVFSIARVESDDRTLSFEDERGLRHTVRVTHAGPRCYTHFRDRSELFVELERFPEPEVAIAPGACVAPMPGKVVKLLVTENDRVAAGDTLLVLEAMKMEHSVKAPEAGIVAEVRAREGVQVEAEAVLVVIRPEE